MKSDLKKLLSIGLGLALLAGCSPQPAEDEAAQEEPKKEESTPTPAPEKEEVAAKEEAPAPKEEPAPAPAKTEEPAPMKETTLAAKEEAPAPKKEEKPAPKKEDKPAPAKKAKMALKYLSTVKLGGFDEGAAEIVAYHGGSKKAFAINGEKAVVSVLDVSDPAAINAVSEIPVGDHGKEFTCVAVSGDLIAVCAAAEDKQATGKVVIMDLKGTVLAALPAGALPDNLSFSPDGKFLVVANEGEPNDEYTNDPEGSVTVVEVAADASKSKATQVTFAGLEAPEGVRVFGPNATLAQDLEPEYVAFSADSKTAYIACQENNAIAVVDLASKKVTALKPLGFKDHSKKGNGFDSSDKTDTVDIKPWPTKGMYMPDAITSVEIGGASYILTANAGDSRDYDGYSEEVRVEDLTLDPDKFPNAAELQSETQLGRLKTTTATGDTDGDGDHDEIYSYGARSLSIWDADLNLVWDSGDLVEAKTSELLGEGFNATNDESGLKDRSDDKGPEPEAVATGKIGGKTYAFLGLERSGGVMVFDISKPKAPKFVTYTNRRDLDADPTTEAAGDLGPECVVFVPAADSGNGKDLVLVSNEVSGTVSVFEFSAE